MKKILLFLLMMVLTVVGTTSCGGDDDDNVTTTSQIVGTWRDIDTSDGNEDWTFNSNGKGYIHFEDITVNGHERIDFTYSLSDNKLTITMTVEGTTMSCTAKVFFSEEGKTLYIYQEDEEEPIVLTKM